MSYPDIGFPIPPFEWPHIGRQWPLYNVQSDQADGLVAWLPTLASRGAQSLRDLSGHGLRGVLSGDVSWVVHPELGAVVKYGGTNGHINCGSSPLLDNLATGKSMSFAAWASWDVLASKTLISKEAASASGWFCVVAGGSLSIRFNAADTDANSSTNAPTAGVLYHVAATYDDNGDRKVRIFLNGLEVAYTDQTAAIGALLDDSALDLTIGSLSPNFWYMNGRIGDVRIYNRGLTDTEVWQLYDPPTRWELYQLPRRLWRLGAIAPPPPTIIPVVMHHYRSVRL